MIDNQTQDQHETIFDPKILGFINPSTLEVAYRTICSCGADDDNPW